MLYDETEEFAPSHVRPQVSGRHLTTLLSFSEGSMGSARIVFRKAADPDTPLRWDETAQILPLIWGRDQHRHLRPINATGKSRVPAVSAVSTDRSFKPNLVAHQQEPRGR
jgi:hypothetical protein